MRRLNSQLTLGTTGRHTLTQLLYYCLCPARCNGPDICVVGGASALHTHTCQCTIMKHTNGGGKLYYYT